MGVAHPPYVRLVSADLENMKVDRIGLFGRVLRTEHL
jgi:hypothetical protein